MQTYLKYAIEAGVPTWPGRSRSRRIKGTVKASILAGCITLVALSSHGQTVGYYPDQGWGGDDHLFSLAYRDNGFDGIAFQPEGGNVVTVCTRLSIRAKESGAGNSTIDVALYKWSGSDWDEHTRATVTIDGGTYSWFHSSVLSDTLPPGYYRLGCCGVTGNPVTIQCGTYPLAESDAFVKPSLSSCPNPWGVSEEIISLDDLNLYMTYTEQEVETQTGARRRRTTARGGDR